MGKKEETALLGMNRAELAAWVESAGEPAYRAHQIADAVYRQRVESIEAISTLPQPLRGRLAEQNVVVGLPRVEKRFVSVDGTVRYLMEFADGQSVETVWMPEGDGGEVGDGTEAGDAAAQGASVLDGRQRPSPHNRAFDRARFDRATICISSQVGCAVDCQFCLTALLGVKRNLTAGEIVGQVCAVLRDQKVSPQHDRTNLVFMGMGEPFLNYDNFMKAVRSEEHTSELQSP